MADGVGSGDHQLYLSAVRKGEAIKEEYDNLHKRYADLMTSHSSTVSKLEVTQEELNCMRKRYEEALHELKGAVRERNGLQQQCTAAIRQWDNALRERNESREQLAKVQQQRDEAMKEINQAMAVRIKATKDLARLTEERNAAVQEYSLIMSERDSVHKEIERLQEELSTSQQKVKALESQKKVTVEEVESLRQEITAVLQDRDHALKECNQLREKYGDFVTGREEDWSLKTYRQDWSKLEGLMMKKGEMPMHYKKNQAQRLDDLDQANREIEALRRQVESIHTELTEAQQEAEVCKRRRDWAFSERDKIVLERESIRTLCDKLRRERDRAVSELAESLRDSDDIKRQRNEASKELKELREKVETQIEKETRMKQLNAVGNSYSHDSAIDADLLEWDVETLEVSLPGFNGNSPGFELAGGREDLQYNGESAIYISNIFKGSIAEGKLRVNDTVLKINQTDVTNATFHSALDTLKNADVLNMVIKRRHPVTSHGVNTFILNLSGIQPTSLTVEPGIFVSTLKSGVASMHKGSISIGDRLITINGKAVESVTDVQSILESSSHSAVITFVKYCPTSSSPTSSCSSGHNIVEPVETEKGPPSVKEETAPVRETPKESYHQQRTLVSTSAQTDDFCLYSPKKDIPVSVISPTPLRRNPTTHERLGGQSSQPTLLDKAYHKIFGERHMVGKERKSAYVTTPSLRLPREEYDPIAQLDSVIEHYSKTSSIKSRKSGRKKEEHSGGTWPKYRGAVFHFAEAGTITSLEPHKKKERKSLGSFSKHASMYENKGSEMHQSSRMSRNGCVEDKHCHLGSRSRERASLFVNHQHGSQSSDCSTVTGVPVISAPGGPGVRGSSSGSSSYTSPDCESPRKDNMGCRSSEHLRYNGATTPESCLDYSVVSAHRDKDVLEFYKNRNRPRPKSTHYVLSDSECLSSIESNLQQYCKPISPTFERISYGNVDSGVSHVSEHSYQTAPPNAKQLLPTNYHLRSGIPFYPLPNGQRISHGHLHHQHPSSGVCNSHSLQIPPSNRYPSPLSIYNSRSGDSLISGSASESNDPRYHSQLGNGCHSMKDSGRYTFTSSPSPCNSQYSYSGPSPTQSIDISHFCSQASKRLIPTHSHVHAPTPYRLEEHYVYDGLSTFPKRNQRIRIPSNPSVTSKSSGGKVSTSSIEKACMSERESPLPAFTVEWQNPDGTHITMDCNRKPKTGDIRNILIEKSSEPLGIQIICGRGGAIFVSSVSENSLASQAGLQVGDQLLEVCGINMRSATYLLAASVLRQLGDSITILVQYNPDKYQESMPSMGNSSEDEESLLHSQMAGTKSVRSSIIYKESRDTSNEDIPSSTTSTLTKQKVSKYMDKPVSHKSSETEPRLIVLKKTTSNLGISLLGGNAVGIFVHSIQDDSPASGPNGLKPGDQILEYNGVDLRQATAEEAAYELAKPADKITVLAHYNIQRYTEVQDQPGDSFYVRALFDRTTVDGSLAFHKDDILYVDNTMFNGVPGLWRAWLVDQEGQKVKCGFIPSKYKMEEELLMKRSLGELDGDGSRRGSTSARRSFFRRKRHQRSNSRDSKELASFSDVSINSCSDSGTIGDEILPPTYQRVERFDYLTMRPVIVVGPLMEVVVDKLEQDTPGSFQRCIPEVMRGTQQMMERGLQELKLVDYRRRGSHFECTSVSAIKEICDKNSHALLDVGISAVERLHRCQIFPIVIFLKFRSTKQIREVKDSRYLTEKVTTKAAKEMHEHALKIESEYKHLINAVIPGSNLAYMCTQVKMYVEDEQNKTLWVPSNNFS